MIPRWHLTLSLALLTSMAVQAAETAPATLVFCAPNYPGTTAEAQPRMDALAASVSELAGWPVGRLKAVYFPQEQAGLTRMREADASVVLVPLPFFLARRAELELTPRLFVVQQGLKATQSWSLVARKDRVKVPADLAPLSVFSSAGYAVPFVTAVALGDFGPLPASVKVTSGPQILSALRKAAKGDPQAALLDEEQAKAIATLPFAGDLEVVKAGPPVPVAVVATLGKRLSEAQWTALSKAFTSLPSKPQGKAALDGARLQSFVPLDAPALEVAQQRYDGASR